MAISKDSVVSIFFEIKDANTNEILEDNTHHEPIEFILGKGSILESLEEEIEKLDAPSSCDILIKKDRAFGEYNPELIQELPKEQFAGIDLQVGMELFGEGEDGQTVRVIVKEIKDDSVVIDYNHPYAGKDLLFSLDILSVREATEDELARGFVAPAHSCGCGGHDDSHGHGGGGCCGGHGGGGCGCHH